MSDTLWNADGSGADREDSFVEIAYNEGFTAPSTAIIEAIASLEDVCPVELATSDRITISDHVDPDSLDQLLTNSVADAVEISFGLDVYTVWIRSDTVTVGRTTDTSATLE